MQFEIVLINIKFILSVHASDTCITRAITYLDLKAIPLTYVPQLKISNELSSKVAIQLQST